MAQPAMRSGLRSRLPLRGAIFRRFSATDRHRQFSTSVHNVDLRNLLSIFRFLRILDSLVVSFVDSFGSRRFLPATMVALDEAGEWEKITCAGIATCAVLDFYNLSKGHHHQESPPRGDNLLRLINRL
ncbi:unnamed protein product [Victoria cruziana]